MLGPRINSDFCKGCGLCIDFCPQSVLGFSRELNRRGVQYAEARSPEKCSGCGICYTMCPDTAIEVVLISLEKSRS